VISWGDLSWKIFAWNLNNSYTNKIYFSIFATNNKKETIGLQLWQNLN
jgi:hypothetical protein